MGDRLVKEKNPSKVNVLKVSFFSPFEIQTETNTIQGKKLALCIQTHTSEHKETSWGCSSLDCDLVTVIRSIDMTHTSPVWLLVSKANKHTHTLSISLSNTHAGTNTAHTQLCWTPAWRQAFRFYHSNRTTRIAAQNLSDRDLEQETDSALCNLFKLCNWFIFASTPFPPPPLLSWSLTQILPFVFIAVSPPTSSSVVWIGYPCTECINIKILHILSFVFF